MNGVILYLAYGMNSNREAMASRCQRAKPLGDFYLSNHRLVFRRYADFEDNSNYIFPVVMWEITDDCLKELDKLEDYSRSYNRTQIGECRFWIYTMNDQSDTKPPSDKYYRLIEHGYKDFALNDYQLRFALYKAA